jgi:hypothetical protein
VFRKAVIAAVVGATCGAVAGYWSPSAETRHGRPAVPAAAAPIAASAGPVSHPPAQPAAVQPQAEPQTQMPPVSRSIADSGAERRRPAADPDADQRVRVLAQRADVKSLVAMREELLRRAEAAGEKDSPATKRQLDEIDRYLTEARVLRLKLDAAEFRKGAAAGIPAR